MKCKVCVCDKCGQTRHIHHTKVGIDQAAKDRKGSIEEIAEEMNRQIINVRAYVEKSKESTRKSREKIAAARNKALTSLEELVRVLKEHEATTMAKLDAIEEKELRGHATQLELFQISINQLQKSVQRCEAILQRNKSIEILQVHQPLVEKCRELLHAEKLNINKALQTVLHARYEINEDLVEKVRRTVPGRVVVSSTDPVQSVALGKGLEEADVGSRARFLITTKDSSEKLSCEEDDQIMVKVETPSGKELTNEIDHEKDGKYSVSYTPDCVGQHDVIIEVNGQPLPGSPWPVHVSAHHYRPLFSFGSHGEEQGQFRYPYDIAINDRTGDVAVADHDNNRVWQFSSEGKHFNTICAKELIHPTSVAFTTSGNVIVIASNKFFCFNETGKLVKNITSKHLEKPFSLTITRDGRMVVCDEGDNTVKVFSSDGFQLLQTICDPDHARPFYAVCHQDMFVVSYHSAHRVKVFSKDGVFLYGIGTRGSGEGQLKYPTGLTIDRFSNLVVCDFGNSRLQFFTLDGKLVSTVEGRHSGMNAPFSITASTTGQLLVTDLNKYSPGVHVFH